MKKFFLYLAIFCIAAFLFLFGRAREEFSAGLSNLEKEFVGEMKSDKNSVLSRPPNDSSPRPSEREMHESFEELVQRVETLPESKEEEKMMALEKAVNMDAPVEKKRHLLEKFLLETRYEDEQLEELSKLLAFDLMLNHVGPEAAKHVLERGQFKDRLRDAMEVSLKNFVPETKLQ